MKSSIFFPIILQILGVIIILAEFVIPSMGILSVGAACVFGYSLYLAYQLFSVNIFFVFVCIDLLMIPVLIWLGVKIISSSPLALKKTLENSHNAQIDNSYLIGKSGKTLTRLIPAGKVIVEEKRYDVVSTGDYVSKGEDIEIQSVNGSRIVVKRKI